MKSFFFLVMTAMATAVLLAFGYRQQGSNGPDAFRVLGKDRLVLRCTPDWNALQSILAETDIPPIPGAGTYSWKISTQNDSAQFYFNQGINMYYAFHIIESMASFQKAARFDPSSAILFWAQALAYGPNINDIGYAASPEALAATREAIRLSPQATPKERMLIKAMEARYSEDSTQKREYLNQLYTDHMSGAYQQFPDDADVAALYADAMMLQHPWDLWKVDGTPKPWTPRIREVLEKLLTKTPEHPGANHYYIHVMEPSPYANLATPSADRLGRLTPGLSHTVHMPSHIYLRTGNYEKGITVNEDAVNSYKKTIPLYAAVTGADFLYIIHNLHMQTNHAMMAGREAYAVQTANELRASISDDYLSTPGALGSYLQYISMTPVLNDVRFGRWDALLAYPAPASEQVYASLLYHFGRGMAFAGKKDFVQAAQELDQLRVFLGDNTLRLPLDPFSPAIEGARVAEQLLLGAIHEKRNMFDGAVRHFAMADSIESRMVYNEPRDWILNPKHYLGDALLKSGDARAAEGVFRKDLENNRDNGWALVGLAKAYELQGRSPESIKTMSDARAAFSRSDRKIEASAY